MRHLAQIGKAFDQSVDQVATSGIASISRCPPVFRFWTFRISPTHASSVGLPLRRVRIVPLPDQHVGMADWVSLRLLDARDPQQRVREVGHHNFRGQGAHRQFETVGRTAALG